MARIETVAESENFVTTWTTGNPPYVILKWTVENLCYADILLKSPCFEISQTSKWNILLDPNLIIDGDTFVGIYVKKDPSSGPNKFMLKGELSVHGPSNELIFDQLFDGTYNRNDSVEFRLAKVFFPVQPTTDDSYLVRCEMVISYEADSVETSRSHLEKLSEDYKQLYDDSKFTDISICASDDIVHAHKAFLHARSPFLAENLDENVTFLSENNEKNPYLAVVLLFLYTGDSNLVLNFIPLEMFGKICKIAKKWRLGDLENLLTPLKMHCKTRIKNEIFQYTWKIKNLTKLREAPSDVLHSSVFFTRNESSSKWKLVLEKQLRNGLEFYGLYLVKVNSDNSSCKTTVEFNIYNNSGHSIVKTREYIFGPRANQKRGFASMFDKNFLQNDLSHDDTLKVICNLKIHLNAESWIDFRSTSIDIVDSDSCFLKYLKSLSRNLKDLYQSQKYSDIKILAGKEMIKAHRGILWARSLYFSSILSKYSTEYIAVSIQPDTLKEILIYMYSAELPNLTALNMRKIYEAAVLLKLSQLLCVCRSYIMIHITVDNVLEIMVLANEHNDDELLEATENFASTPGNAKMFLDTQKWRTFRKNHTTLAFKIYHNLSWSYCNYF